MTLTARRLDGAAAVSSALAALPAGSLSGVFQTPLWLGALYRDLAPKQGARALAVEICDAANGDLILFLPLIATRERGLTVARVPSLGVSDYGGPVLGRAAPETAEEAGRLWQALTAALTGIDLIELENMPRTIGGRVNPLALLDGAVVARHRRHALAVPGTVEELLRALGKKYRKEAERCGRLLAERGTPFFLRAETDNEIAATYAVLEAQQFARRQEAGGRYVLDRPEYSQFYEAVIRAGTPHGRAHLFTLGAGDDVGACLFGLTHDGTFTLLRISTAGGEWKRVSPGRLVVLEAMRALIADGVRTFDMGIGDYAFKHGFGIEPEGLVSLTQPLSLKGWPRAAMIKARDRARQSDRLRGLIARIRRT